MLLLDVNDCMGNPCNNGGNCTDGIATYTCTCPNGFRGSDCETSISNDSFHFYCNTMTRIVAIFCNFQTSMIVSLIPA